MRAELAGLCIALSASLCFSLSACSMGADKDVEAKGLAVQACTSETVQSREGFNPNASTPSELATLANMALVRSQLAGQAAVLNERWLLLSEASAAIAVFAQQLLEQRVKYDAGETASAEGSISSSMWDEYKSASNAYLAECRYVLKDVSKDVSIPDST